MSLCGDFVELVEKFKLLDDDDFVQLKDTDIENEQLKAKHIEVYIEKLIIPKLEEKPLTIIDAVVGKVKGKKVGLLFIKKIKCIRLLNELILKMLEDLVIHGCARAVFKDFSFLLNLPIHL